jgi:hypothetical protein
VLSEATSGSVAQVTSLLSLEGSALDLAATLLTVSLVSVESESGGSVSAATGAPGAAPGAGQALMQGQGNDSRQPEEEPHQEAGTSGPAKPPAGMDRPPIWERISLGLERAWEKARAVILEDEGRMPATEHPRAAVPPATGRKLAPPVPAPGRPRTKDGTAAQAKPVAASDDAVVDPRPPIGASFMQTSEDAGRVVDAALRGMCADRDVDEPLARSGMGLWGEPAQAQSAERTRLLVAMVASAVVASAGRTLHKRGIQRRSGSISHALDFVSPLRSRIDRSIESQ